MCIRDRAKAQLTGTPDDRDVETDLAQMYIRLKRFSEASAQMDKADATATKPEEKLYGFFLRGEFYERQKMYDQAEVNFRKALAIDPQNAAVLNYLGYMPVSYTHLDVYKRQGLHNALAVALIGCARGMLRRGIEPRTQHVVRVGGAVSYTHLDVYKRQGERLVVDVVEGLTGGLREVARGILHRSGCLLQHAFTGEVIVAYHAAQTMLELAGRTVSQRGEPGSASPVRGAVRGILHRVPTGLCLRRGSVQHQVSQH